MDSQTPWDTYEEQKIYKESSIVTDAKHNKHTVIKYTKIPDYDQPLNMWCGRSQVRIRNYVTIDDQSDVKMTHSFRSELFPHVPNYTRRKVVTLEESDNDKTFQAKSALKCIAKSNGAKKNTNTRSNNKRESTRTVFRAPLTNPTKIFHMARRVKSPVKIKTSYNSITTRSRSRKPCLKSIESNQELIIIDSPSITRYPEDKSLKHIHNAILGLNLNNASDIIYVPIERSEHKEYLKSTGKNVSSVKEPILTEKSILVEQIYESAKNNSSDIQIETYPEIIIDKDTSTCIDTLDFDQNHTKVVNNKKNDEEMQVDIKRESVAFGSLCIPNVSLIEENDVNKFESVSSPSLYVSHVEKSENANKEQSECYKTPSYIISRATLTYTTKQKIDFHVVTNNEESQTSPKLVASYPMNVVSVFRDGKNKERQSLNLKSRKNIIQRDINQNIETNSHIDCSSSLELIKPSEVISTLKLDSNFVHKDYFYDQFQKELNFIDSFFESLQYLQNNSVADKILRKSITMREDKLSLTKLHEFTAKIYSEQALANLNSNISQATNEDVERVACKSLCLLNMLIKNEQRRAKNLLFVLKLREDSLRDFTKSQILWLESKKKYENTDVSALKKKQRGALLKLQHECGEMQRIRKALLNLSEKRKSVLLKTKKNIEQKLNQMNVKNPVLYRKKRLKRNPLIEHKVPLKCFDLSSSGEDTSSSKSFSEVVTPSTPSHNEEISLQPCNEKYLPTGNEQKLFLKDNLCGTTECYVTVDGSYLNILFHNLKLPEIFSSGREYEVNKEALKNIIQSANNLRDTVVLESAVVTSLMSQLKSAEKSKSSSPSTARSLVEEFDQYYKDQDYSDSSPEKNMPDMANCTTILQGECEVKENLVQTVVKELKENVCGKFNGNLETSISDKEKDSSEINILEIHDQINKNESHLGCIENFAVEVSVIEEMSSQFQLPSKSKINNNKVVVSTNAIAPDVVKCKDCKPQTSALQISVPSEDMVQVNEPLKPIIPLPSAEISSTSEAEELMRQQIAIEREIKALEQQQSQFLVVREIPDKPPPPYTPPTESRPSSGSPKPFKPDLHLQKIITEHFSTHKGEAKDSEKAVESGDSFEGLVHNYCDEMIERMNIEKSDKPWHPYNLLPKRQEMSPDQIKKKILADLKQALSGPPPTALGPVSRRGTDYIDDILFGEWPRCESEWTNLQSDEALVKNQVFENIFEKILDDAIKDFKVIFSSKSSKEN